MPYFEESDNPQVNIWRMEGPKRSIKTTKGLTTRSLDRHYIYLEDGSKVNVYSKYFDSGLHIDRVEIDVPLMGRFRLNWDGVKSLDQKERGRWEPVGDANKQYRNKIKNILRNALGFKPFYQALPLALNNFADHLNHIHDNIGWKTNDIRKGMFHQVRIRGMQYWITTHPRKHHEIRSVRIYSPHARGIFIVEPSSDALKVHFKASGRYTRKIPLDKNHNLYWHLINTLRPLLAGDAPETKKHGGIPRGINSLIRRLED
ncbi:MAG: hypothetical protein AABX01_04640 [Candidatus Micrarchaeota archaeon]